ncbi:MAG: phosphate signaling complex protein PhoU [Acidobacteriota bacterium]
MERHFDIELNELKNRLLYMASLAESMIHNSIKSLVEKDDSFLKDVYIKEDEVNRLHIEIDERSLKLLALHQPAAADLRFILAAAKINTDLERMADQAINISESVQFLITQPQLKPLIDIPRMTQIAEEMVRESIDSFIRKDIDNARRILKRDDEVDALKNQVFNELLVYMISDSSTIKRALNLILISRHLERIADHATNIAEDVIFMVAGKDVRHHLEEIK